MKIRISKIKIGFIFGLGLTYLASIGCGNANNPYPVPNSPTNPYANNQGMNSMALNGNWRVVSMTCNGIVEDQIFYTSPNSIGISLTNGTGVITVSEISPACAASAQIASSTPTAGQTVFKLTNSFTLSPAGCTFGADYNQIDIISDFRNGVPFSSNGLGGAGYPGYNTGYNPSYPQAGYNPSYPQNGYNPSYPQVGYNPSYPQNGVYPNSGYSAYGNTLTLTSTTVLPCRTGGSGTHVITLSH